MTPDEEQLRLLSIFHYVVAGIAVLFSLFPVFHIVMGAMIVSGRFDNAAGPPGDDMFGWLFIALGAMFLVAGFAFSVCVRWRAGSSRNDARTPSASSWPPSNARSSRSARSSVCSRSSCCRSLAYGSSSAAYSCSPRSRPSSPMRQ